MSKYGIAWRQKHIDERFNKFLDKSWKVQESFELRLKNTWRRALERRRKKLEGRELPELKDMLDVRNGLLIAIFICLLLPNINVFTHWFDFEDSPCYDRYGIHYSFCDDPPKPWYAGLDVYGTLLSAVLGLFAFIFDYSIWKRFGPENSFLDYGPF